MINISGFFQKFLKLEKDSKLKKEIIVEVIKKNTGLDLSLEMLDVKGDNVKLNCNPVFRNEIFMHKLEIEDSLKSKKIFLNII